MANLFLGLLFAAASAGIVASLGRLYGEGGRGGGGEGYTQVTKYMLHNLVHVHVYMYLFIYTEQMVSIL